MLPRSFLVVGPGEVVVAGIARTELACAGPASAASIGIQALSGIDRRREPAADSIVSQFAALARYVVAFGAGHGHQPPALGWIRAAGRGQMPSARSHMRGEATASRRAPPAEIVDRPRSRNQWPPPPASRHVCAVGGFRAWAEECWPQGQLTSRQYSYLTRPVSDRKTHTPDHTSTSRRGASPARDSRVSGARPVLR